MNLKKGKMEKQPKKPTVNWEAKKKLLEKANCKCVYCGFDFLESGSHFGCLDWDHLTSQKDKGTDEGNLVPACRLCNVLKGKRSFSTVEEGKKVLDEMREKYLKTWGYYDLRNKCRRW